MGFVDLQKSVLVLIQQGKFDEVLPILKQAAEKADTQGKEILIPFYEDSGLECYYNQHGFFAAGWCYLLAAELCAAVLGEGDERTVRRYFRAANHFAGPDCHLTDQQKRDSAKQAVAITQKLRAILEQYRTNQPRP